MQCTEQLGCPNDITLPSCRGSVICSPAAFSSGFVKESEQSLLPGDAPVPLWVHRVWCFPVPWLCWLHRLRVQQRWAHCHFSPLSQKHFKIQMGLPRKSWIIFHLLLHSGETKWNKVIYRRQLYPLLLIRYNESVISWNNSSDFELMSKGWAGLNKQNTI